MSEDRPSGLCAQRTCCPVGAQTESLCSGAKQNFGPAGFEPTTCRRGDRSTIQHGKFVADSPRLEIALSSHGFGPSRETFLFHVETMGFRGAWPWNDRHYADVSDRQAPDMNQHSIGLFSCSEGHKHETCLSGL